MRDACFDCVRKHIAQAIVLTNEAQLGYPTHRWLAIGHLAEAEAESILVEPNFADRLRRMRLQLMDGKNDPALLMQFLEEAMGYAKKDYTKQIEAMQADILCKMGLATHVADWSKHG